MSRAVTCKACFLKCDTGTTKHIFLFAYFPTVPILLIVMPNPPTNQRASECHRLVARVRRRRQAPPRVICRDAEPKPPEPVHFVRSRSRSRSRRKILLVAGAGAGMLPCSRSRSRPKMSRLRIPGYVPLLAVTLEVDRLIYLLFIV